MENEGQALATLGKSLWPCIFIPGNCFLNLFIKFSIEIFWAAVLVSAALNFLSVPPEYAIAIHLEL